MTESKVSQVDDVQQPTAQEGQDALRALIAEMRGLASFEWRAAEQEGHDFEGSQVVAMKSQATADTSKYWADKLEALLRQEERQGLR